MKVHDCSCREEEAFQQSFAHLQAVFDELSMRITETKLGTFEFARDITKAAVNPV